MKRLGILWAALAGLSLLDIATVVAQDAPPPPPLVETREPSLSSDDPLERQVAKNTIALESDAVKLALVNKMDSILIALGTFVAALGGLVLAVVTALRQGKTLEAQTQLKQAQHEADKSRATVVGKLDELRHQTNSLSEQAQAAALEKGIGLGIQRERDRQLVEMAAAARGRLEAEAIAAMRARDLAVIPPSVAPLLPLSAIVRAVNGGETAAAQQVHAAEVQNVAADKQVAAAERVEQAATDMENVVANQPDAEELERQAERAKQQAARS